MAVLPGRYANDTAIIDNSIFAAFRVSTPPTYSHIPLLSYSFTIAFPHEYSVASAMYTAGN
jgi:hypothetical protein